MFVLSSTYEREVHERRLAEKALARYINKWNELVDRINKKGGEAFLNGDVKDSIFDDKEIKQLISWSHPDKHDGKDIATNITKKLLKLKESSK